MAQTAQSTALPSAVDHDLLVAAMKEEFPHFRVVPKAGHRLSRAIDLGLKLVTLGGQRGYLTRYHTVLGNTLYVPTSWAVATETERMIILRHERVHLRQRRRLGGWLMALVYLLPFVPLGLAYGRARLEWAAYRETLSATAEYLGLGAVKSPLCRQRIVERFTGADYGWMWPFPSVVGRWYDEVVAELEARQHGRHPRDRASPGGGSG
jgi:hypothetical protein